MDLFVSHTDSSLARRARRGPRRAALLSAMLAACAAGLVLAIPAQAATRPSVTTLGAKEVTFNSATLHGSVNPNGADTSYYFQYGLTRAYGGQTAIADAGAGTHNV